MVKLIGWQGGSLTIEEGEDKKKISKWPFVWGFLLYTAGNIDYCIIPFILEPMGLSFWGKFLIATPLANLEIIAGFYFWYWFAWKWLPTTESVKETVELTKSIITLLKEYGLLGTIIYKVRGTFKWATSNKFSRFIKVWGRIGMFSLGAESFISGGRLVGTILCASTKSKNGLYYLMAGNTIHVAISVWTWGLVFYLWDIYRVELVSFCIIMTLFIARRFIWKKLIGDKEPPKSP